MRCVLLLPIVIGLSSGAALASSDDDPAPGPTSTDAAAPESPEDEARRAFGEGKKQYNLGNFEGALERFSRAYELRPAPLLLFNIGQCHRQLKNHERAIFFFDGFLRESPESEDREVVEGLIAEERALLEAEKTSKTVQAHREAFEASGPAPTPVAPVVEDEASWVPWAVGGGIVVALAAAGVTAAVIASQPQGRQGFDPPTLGEVDLR